MRLVGFASRLKEEKFVASSHLKRWLHVISAVAVVGPCKCCGFTSRLASNRNLACRDHLPSGCRLTGQLAARLQVDLVGHEAEVKIYNISES